MPTPSVVPPGRSPVPHQGRTRNGTPPTIGTSDSVRSFPHAATTGRQSLQTGNCYRTATIPAYQIAGFPSTRPRALTPARMERREVAGAHHAQDPAVGKPLDRRLPEAFADRIAGDRGRYRRTVAPCAPFVGGGDHDRPILVLALQGALPIGGRKGVFLETAHLSDEPSVGLHAHAQRSPFAVNPGRARRRKSATRCNVA